MSDIKDEKNQQEGATNIVEPEVVSNEIGSVEPEVEESTFDLMDDFHCGELLLDADEDRGAFKLFLRVATDKKEDGQKRKAAIDKLLYIALKNSHNQNLLDNDTWKEIEKLSKKGKGYEYAYLLLHFRYYAMGGKVDNDLAYENLEKYFKCCEKNSSEISPIAYMQKGKCLDFGVGVSAEEVDTAKAIVFYNKALDGGCVAAYKPIVCAYMYGADNFEEKQEEAKRIITKAIKYLKKQVENNRNDVKPFFEDLVNCCYFFSEEKFKEKMINKGKEFAQYMINNNIKGGSRLMGDYYIYSEKGYSLTMAKNYYEEAIKNDECVAYGQLADVYMIGGNLKDAFKWASQGCTKNHAFSYITLGQMYEERGKKYKKKDDRAKKKKCYFAAWDCYEKSYYKFGVSPGNMGRLYLDEGILPKKFELKELERILEIGAKQLRSDAIKYYLKLLLRKNSVNDSEINYEIANKLPESVAQKYNYYMEVGAYTGDVIFIEPYIKSKSPNKNTIEKLYKKLLEKHPYLSVIELKSVYEFADDATKAKVTKILLKQVFVLGDQLKSIYESADDKTKIVVTKKVLKQTFLADDQIESIYKYGDENIKSLCTKKLMDKIYLSNDQIEFLYQCADDISKIGFVDKLLKNIHSLDDDGLKTIYGLVDDEVRAKFFKKIIKDCRLSAERIEFIYKHADEKTRAMLSKKLVISSYITSSKKEFVEISENYKGRQDDSFIRWLNISAARLFINENKDEYIKLINGIKDHIEKAEDENLKELWGAWHSNIDKALWGVVEEIGDETVNKLCASYRNDSGYTDWEAFIQSLSEFENLEEGTRERFETVRKGISDAILEVGYNNLPTDELMSAISNSKDVELKKIYENYSRVVDAFMDSLIKISEEKGV